MDEYLCVTAVGEPGEPDAGFKARLTAFWSGYLRAQPDDYEKVYAEATAFEAVAGRPTRRYLVAADGAAALAAGFGAAGVGCDPVDADDVYPKYEASGPDWFQIEH